MNRPALDDILPLSAMQEGMLFHSLLDPDGGVDFEQLLYRFDGDLDPDALDAAWQAVVARHSALRARLLWQGVDQPLQLIERDVTVPVHRLDWSAMTEPERAGHLAGWLEQDRATGFDLHAAPLLRVALIRTGAGEHLMVLSFHHVLLDGWSVRLVLRELMVLYRAHRDGQEPRLEPAPRYATFIRWLKAQDTGAAERYWTQELGGITTPTQITGERRTGDTGFAAVELEFDAVGSELLRAFAREQRITVNTLVQGAWALLLARYSGDRDVVFGATMSTRPAEADRIESMVGLMINTLPMRVRVDRTAPVGAWLRSVQDAQLRLRQFDYTPLVRAQQLSGVPQGTALFDSLLVFENYPAARPEDQRADGLELTPVGAVERNGYPLSVVAAMREALQMEITYDRSLFDPGRIERLAGHLRTLVTGLCADPAAPVAAVSMLTAAEREQILVEWNSTTTQYPSDRCVHELFEARAAEHPDRPAVHALDGTSLTYGELNSRANRLAHHLRGLGAGPERCVGICATPSAEALIGLFGILKSGAGYVPLDPGHPADRLGFMLADTDAMLVVAERATLTAVPDEFTDRIVPLDREMTVAVGCPDTDPSPAARADNLAYVMYTSGSTGRPKGVLVPHQGLVNYLWWGIDGYGLEGASGAPMLGSLAFDLSMPNYFLPLIGGRDVTLLPSERSLDSLRERLLAPGDFSLLKITPGHLDVLRATMSTERVHSVRTFVIGADEVKPETMAAWARIAPGARVINEYGPTETVVGCSIYLAGADFDPSVPVPIGRPIANIRMYVLDEDLNPLPAGVVGELFIGGDGVARGYLNRPDITAEKFVPDPFGQGRLYRTGDLARFRPDGDLEFLGRIDHQVKIRGYRVELGEIEARLLAHPAVTEAVVVAREDTPGDRRLVGYVVAPQDPPSVPQLHAWLEQVLPSYMVPATMVFLDTLPLSGNGKVDRGGLPAPDSARPDTGTRLVEPRTALEIRITAVWCRLLGLDRVGVFDDFFALGGHSLLATQVVSRLARETGTEIPLRWLFETPTVAGLAERISAASGAPAVSVVRRGERPSSLPLSFGQRRLWFMDQMQPGSVEYVVPMAWRLTGPVDVAALRTAIEGVVARHEVLRTALVAAGGEAEQVVSAEVPVELPVLDTDPARLHETVTELAATPFELSEAPLWRVALVRVREGEHVLLWVLHHSVADAWSAGVLVRELGAGYRAALAGESPVLGELSVQYADFAVWQREWLSGAVLERQLAYWRGALAGLAPLELPTDRPRAAVRSTEGAAVDFALSGSVAEAVRVLARVHGVTVFMVLLAGLQVVLSRYSGQRDVAVGTPIANRNRPEIEPLVGFFVNTLVLRTDLSGDPVFTELLARVREVTLGAYEHQDLPFERLVEELAPERDLARTPLFQVLLSMDNTDSTDGTGWDLPGIKAESYLIPASQAKVDLTVALKDTPEAILGTVRYSTALFDADRIQRLCGYLETTFAAVGADPALRLSQVPVLPAAELHRTLTAWNDTAADVPDVGLHDLVHTQALARPDAPALSARDGCLTYAELDTRAERLATHLRTLGVGPETVVGICLPRSIDAVVALLAVLKAGGAYLPLDPNHPAERLAFQLEDAGHAVLLASRATGAALPASAHGRVLWLDEVDWTTDATASPVPPRAPLVPGNAAYVMYTSGSTGRPKGVVTTHAAAVSHVSFLRAEHRIGPGDVAVALSGTGFDASVREIFTALGSGAHLVLAPPDAAADPRAVVELLIAHRVTVVPSIVPSLLYELAKVPLEPETVRLVLCSGERLRAARLSGREWLRDRVVNQFGPTEATMTTTRVRLAEQDPPHYRIGRPIANSRVYVLDEWLNPCPTGVWGELYIGGAGIARGYLARPGLTAQRFVPDPFGRGRLYRTGDECRWAADGGLEHRGRTDHQVKLRGHRVEPGEIESCLLSCPGVAETVVVVREDEPGDQRLVAYLVAGDSGPTVSAMRTWLEQTLPEHLIPAAFVTLPALPLTPNGKVDRAALPEPGTDRPALDTGFTAPRTEWEIEVARIWSEVLGVDRIGVRDDFFDLGGHSLLAAHVIARLRARHQVSLPLRAMFDARTLGEFARRITGEDVPEELVVDLNDHRGGRTLFWVHEGTGSITGYYELARRLRADCAVVGIAFDDALLESDAPDVLAAMATRYVELVRQRQPEGPYLICGWSMGGVVAYEMAAQLHRAGLEVEWVGLVDSVVRAPETANRNRVDRLLDELLGLSGEITEQDWNRRAEATLSGHLRELDLRQEQIGLGKQALETALRRNRFFRMAKRNYRPRPADVPLHVLKATEGNWDWSSFEAWNDYVPAVEFVEAPGTHLSIMDSPQVEQVLTWLRKGVGFEHDHS